MLFVWAFGGGSNPSKANWAKATIIWFVVAIVMYVVFFIYVFPHMFITNSTTYF